MKYKWNCEDCNRSGVVKLPDDTDMMTAIYVLKDAHWQAGADCVWRPFAVRVEKIETSLFKREAKIF